MKTWIKGKEKTNKEIQWKTVNKQAELGQRT